MFGFDFSHWNSDEQWARRMAEADFVFHKCSEGKNYIDPKCLARIQNMPKDKLFGIYHLIRPQQNSVDEEFTMAKKAFGQVRALGRPCGLAIDVEANYVPYNSDYLPWLKDLVTRLNKEYNQNIIIYLGDLYPDGWYTTLKAAGGVFWIARWNTSKVTHECTFWQTTSKWEGENLDHDKAMVDDAEVRRLLGHTGTTPQEDDELDKALETIADAVIAGRYGVGVTRKDAIYRAVQDKVNIKMRGN